MASMFDTIADMLRGSAPDDLAHALGTDRTQTRRAMEIGLPALITGLRDKTLEPGGAQNLASMLDDANAALPSDLDAYLSAGDPAQGAAMLDVAFGDRGEPALGALSSASGLSTRLLAQVMSVLAPLATGVVGSVADRSPEGLRTYLAGAVDDLEGKGFGRVVDLVSPDLPDVDLAAADEAFLVETDSDDSDDTDDIADTSDVDADADEAAIVVDDGEDLFGVGDTDATPDADEGGTVVEGVFPDPDELVVFDDEIAPIDLGDATEALEVPDDIPSFDVDLANVAPAGVEIEGEFAPVGGAVALADPDLPDMDPVAEPDGAALEGQGLSGMGWLWWLIGAVLGVIILFFAIQQCGGSDGEEVGTTGDTAEATTVPTPDPALAQRQATLNGILADYPGVTGEVIGSVAVLNGTVETETDRAVLDNAVREAGLGVQNNVTSTAPPVSDGAAGFTLGDLIAVQPELSTLGSLLEQAGMGQALNGVGPFTLFAPTNDAFAAIADQMVELQNDPAALQQVLSYHVVIGAQDAATIAGQASLPTLLTDESIMVGVEGESIVLNGSVPVLVGDAPANNGVMHIISGVLLPATDAELPEEIGVALGLAPITFASGGSDLTDAGKVELDKVVAFLLETPGNIEIGGHTDADGEPGFNLTLSQDRAEAVKAYMAEQGIPADSMTAVGFGETEPIAANDTAENKALNRRIEFRPS